MTQFCVSCGTALESEPNFCQRCGRSASRTSSPPDSNPQQDNSSRNQPSGKKTSQSKRNVVFGLVFALILAAAVNSLIGSEERDTCRSFSIILGPVNEGPPDEEEFRKTWIVLDALARETSNLELKTAIKSYSMSGKTVSSLLRTTGNIDPVALADLIEKSEQLVSVCESFF